MSLVWHIARKDLRRLRWLVALWGTVIAAKLGVGVMLVFGVGGDFKPLGFASYWTAGLEMIAGYFLVAMILHGDVLVGSSSFWMTRPVSASRLFTAKLVALAVVFGVIPCVLTLPWWLWCGYGLKEVGLASLETLGLQGLMVAVALPAASLTEGMSRYVFWTLIMVTALIFLVSGFVGFPAGGWWAASLILMISGVVGAGLHGWKRRFLAAAAVLGGAVTGAAAIVAVLILGSATGNRVQAQRESASALASSIRVSFEGAGLFKRDTLQIQIGLEGMSSEFVLEGAAIHRWSWRDGVVLERQAGMESANRGADWIALGLRSPLEEYNRDLLRSSVARGRTPPGSRQSDFNGYVQVPAAFENRVRRDPPSYSTRMELALLRPRVLGECSVETGKTIVSVGERTRVIAATPRYVFFQKFSGGAVKKISGVKPPPDPATGVPTTFSERRLLTLAEYRSTVFGSGEPHSGIGPVLFSGWPRRTYAVVNRARGNAVEDELFYRPPDTFRTGAVRIGTVGIVWRMMQIAPPAHFSAADNAFVDESDWFEGVTLAKLALREEERFTKELAVERFEVSGRASAGGKP